MIKKCKLETCHLEFVVVVSNKRSCSKEFCSRKCSAKYNGYLNKGRLHTTKWKEEMSRKTRGSNNPFFGKSHSSEFVDRLKLERTGSYEERYGIEKAKEIKSKLSLAMSGCNNPFYGKKHTDDSKQLISMNHANSSGENNPMFGKGYLLQGENNGSWLGGISFGEYGEQFSEELKTFVRQRDNFVCKLCGEHGHVVHHIDYIKSNNNTNNLVTLCHTCHGKTNFNREHWTTLFVGLIS